MLFIVYIDFMFSNRPNSYEGDRKDLTLIRTGLRQAFTRSKYKAIFLSLSRVEIPQYNKSGKLSKRPMVRYLCAECKCLHPSSDINVDHIEKVGSFDCISEIKDFFDRIFCSYDNLQVLCKPCHDVKTKQERKAQAMIRKINKENIL